MRQEVDFGKATGPNPEEQLKKYVLRIFLPTSRRIYADGWPGGFTWEQLLYCTADGHLGATPKTLNSAMNSARSSEFGFWAISGSAPLC